MTVRQVLTDKFLMSRPSFKRFRAKCSRLGLEVDRDDYDAAMRDIRQLKPLFKAAEVDPETVRVDRLVLNSWGNKDNPSFQVKATLTPKGLDQEAGPAPARPRKYRVSKSNSAGHMDVLMIPDAHVGWHGSEPIHDPAAVEAVLSVAARFQPSKIVILGDFLDLAGFGTYKNDAGYLNRTSDAIQTAYEYLARLRAGSPRAEIWYIEGNHEYRIANALRAGTPEAGGLKRAGGEEVLGIPHLLRLDELGIAYVGPYKTHVWIEGVRYLHGELLGASGGLTVAKMLGAYQESSVCGHVHRLELAYRTEATEWGNSSAWAMSCGTLARLDGIVPGSRYPNWQQGFGVLWSGGQPAIYQIQDGLSCVQGIDFKVDLTEV